MAFARILVRDPHVVILDEATARLDPVTEARVQRATERLLADRIGIVIAHRLSSVRRCDEVVVLADGAVVEAGPLRESERFAELLATSHAGAYASAGGGRGGVDLLRRARPAVGRRPSRHAAPVAGRPAGRRRPYRRATRRRCPPAPPARTLREILRLGTNDPRYGLVSVGAVHRDGRCSAWTARCCRGCGPTWWTAAASPWLPAAGHRRRAAGRPAAARTHQPVVPGVVGPADAADQPAPGARADRAAPGQRAHPGRGGRPGRRHRAGGACSPTT